MKKEAPNENRLDEQEITKAAQAALRDLELEAEVKSVAQGERWCVQFTADYNQFCDSFRDQFGKANSPELIREKIKRHILRQQQSKIRSGVRVRRAKPKPTASSDNLLETAWKTIEGAVSQTADAAGEIVNQALALPEQALTAIAGAPGTPPQTLMRVSVKPAARKSTKKSSRSARKTTKKKGGATRKGAGLKKKPAAKKRTSTKSSKKSANKSSRKKSATKKSASKKSARKKSARGK